MLMREARIVFGERGSVMGNILFRMEKSL